jgi:hypothetical protein
MIERVYHHFETWEDFKWGMYDKTCFMDEQTMINDCMILLACPKWLWESMTFVSHNWGRAAEHNLTNSHRNRQAWLGQAACNMTHGAPEYLTKVAWNLLTKQKQDAANAVADDVINDWESKYKRGYFEWQKSNSELRYSQQRKRESATRSIISNGFTCHSAPGKTQP